jgi:hypothetical protein
VKPIKAGRALIEFIKLCYAAQRPPLLIGKHGVGKSEILQQAASELHIGFICRDLSIMEPPDLVGMPKLGERTTSYLPPAFLPTSGKGLLVFEELNRCPQYMRAPCLQLLTARTLNDYTLPPGWLPAAAINPSEGEYETQELDPALLSRFTQASVVADPTEWLLWAESAGVHEEVIRYVGQDPTVFKDDAYSNPRSWKAVSDLLQVSADAPKNTLHLAIAGTVGSARAAAFSTFRNQGAATLPNAQKLLSHYSQLRSRIQECVTEGRLDILNQAVHSVKLLLQSTDSYTPLRRNKKSWHNLGRFLEDLPPDLAEGMRSYLKEHHRSIPESKRTS